MYMKKILITIGLLLILATGVAIFMEEFSKNNLGPVLDNPIPDGETVEDWQNNQNQTTNQNSGELSGSWIWKSSIDASGETVTPKDSNQFVITFSNEGRLSSTTDCNNISGSYIKNEEVISVGSLVSTKMGCMEETLEMDYAAQLALATSHTIEGDTLKIILAKDAGVMTFTRK